MNFVFGSAALAVNTTGSYSISIGTAAFKKIIVIAKTNFNDPLLKFVNKFKTVSYIVYDYDINYQIVVCTSKYSINITQEIPLVSDYLIQRAIETYNEIIPRWILLYMILKEEFNQDVLSYLMSYYLSV